MIIVDDLICSHWQGVLPELLLEIQTIFQHEAIFTPADLEQQFNGTWPSIDTLTAAGWRVLFVTGYDYGKVIDPYMFSKCVFPPKPHPKHDLPPPCHESPCKELMRLCRRAN